VDNVQDNNSRQLDIPDAAAALGLSIEAICKRIRRGTLVATKVDGRWMVSLNVQDSRSPADNASRTINVDQVRNVQDTRVDASVAAVAALERALEAERARANEERARSVALEAELLAAREAAAMHQERSRNLEEETKRLRAQLALPPTQPEPVPSTDPMEELRAKVDELTRQLQAQPDPEPRSWWQRWRRG